MVLFLRVDGKTGRSGEKGTVVGAEIQEEIWM